MSSHCKLGSFLLLCVIILQTNVVDSESDSGTLKKRAHMEAPEPPHYVSGTHSTAFVTTPSIDVAKNLAKRLIEQHLAACVNIVPSVVSIYKWEGEVNEDNETLMIIKTRTSKMDEVISYVRKNHPYSVAEVISMPIQNGNPPYLKWIGDNVPA